MGRLALRIAVYVVLITCGASFFASIRASAAERVVHAAGAAHVEISPAQSHSPDEQAANHRDCDAEGCQFHHCHFLHCVFVLLGDATPIASPSADVRLGATRIGEPAQGFDSQPVEPPSI
jgi:hypothetical protein